MGEEGYLGLVTNLKLLLQNNRRSMRFIAEDNPRSYGPLEQGMSWERVLNDPSLFKLQGIRAHPKIFSPQAACGSRQTGYPFFTGNDV